MFILNGFTLLAMEMEEQVGSPNFTLCYAEGILILLPIFYPTITIKPDSFIIGFRDGLVQKLLEIQKSQFENTWQRHIYDTFDNIKDVIRNDSFRRQRKLALQLPFNTEFKAASVPDLTITLAKMYGSISLKTIQRDLEKLEDLHLVTKYKTNYKANEEIILRMIAKKKKRNEY